MTITPVDSKKDLFFVEDIYPEDLLIDIINTNHLQADSEKQNLQEHYPRVKIKQSNPLCSRVDAYVKSLNSYIQSATAINYLACDTAFWLDLPGFDMQSHLDNDGVYAAMQIYLTENTKPMPTVFYNSDGSIRFEPEYRVNSGYLMLNNMNQWHAMPYTVPDNEYRLTSYTWFWRNE